MWAYSEMKMSAYRLKVPIKGVFVFDVLRCVHACIDCGRATAAVRLVGHVNGCKYTKKGAV